jgi:hypothetical protein
MKNRKPARKIAQLAVANGLILAVSDDGSAFSLKLERNHELSWQPLPPLPQP